MNDTTQMSARPKTFREGGKVMNRPEPDAKRTIGFGSKPDMSRLKSASGLGAGVGDLAETIRAAVACPTYNMPVIEQVRWTIGGPMLDADVQRNFGEEIDLYGSGKNVPGVDYVETTMAQPGQLQTNTLVLAIGFHVECDPLCFATQGNAFSTPAVAAATPFSPDAFTANDIANGAFGAGVAAGTSVYLPANLQWGTPMLYAAWHMARGYDLRWRIGQKTNIMDEVLRHSAYMPDNGQSGSASSSQVEIYEFVRRVNNRYAALGSPLDFLPTNALRLGSVTVAAANVGIFRPSRAFDLAPVTYGGLSMAAALRDPKREFRQLSIPYLIGAGIPIGLIAQANDNVQAGLMREYLSISCTGGPSVVSNGGTPPQISPGATIALGNTTTSANQFLEQTLDAAPVNVAQQVRQDRVLFKGGEIKVTMPLKGFEVDANWYDVLKANPDIRDAVLAGTAAHWAQQ